MQIYKKKCKNVPETSVKIMKIDCSRNQIILHNYEFDNKQSLNMIHQK